MKVDVVTTARALPDTKAVSASITFEGDDARFRIDGELPTADTGHLASAGGSVDIYDDELSKFRVISTGATTLQVTLYNKRRDTRYS